MACEVNTCESVIVSELVFENALSDLEPAEIVALLSCLVFQEKDGVEPVLTEKLVDARNRLVQICKGSARFFFRAFFFRALFFLCLLLDVVDLAFSFSLPSLLHVHARSCICMHANARHAHMHRPCARAAQVRAGGHRPRGVCASQRSLGHDAGMARVRVSHACACMYTHVNACMPTPYTHCSSAAAVVCCIAASLLLIFACLLLAALLLPRAPFSLCMQVAYEWARGTSFRSISELCEILEVSFVRCIVLLDEA